MNARDVRIASFLALLGFAFAGCRCQEEEVPVASTPMGVTHCLEGIQRSVQAQTLAEATSLYYDGCADLFSNASCRDAWKAAAKEPDVSARLGVVAKACRVAYCPTFSAFGFGICKDDFVATNESVLKEWPPLFDAIVAREAGVASADLSPAFLGFIVHAAELAAKEAQAKAGENAAPSAAPPGSAAPTASAAPSAAPPASGAAPSPPPAASAGTKPTKETAPGP